MSFLNCKEGLKKKGQWWGRGLMKNWMQMLFALDISSWQAGNQLSSQGTGFSLSNPSLHVWELKPYRATNRTNTENICKPCCAVATVSTAQHLEQEKIAKLLLAGHEVFCRNVCFPKLFCRSQLWGIQLTQRSDLLSDLNFGEPNIFQILHFEMSISNFSAICSPSVTI